jgi:diguanylate cyclase (GGDEF)-like protein
MLKNMDEKHSNVAIRTALRLAGSYKRFLTKAPKIITGNRDQRYALIYIDIIQFKYINDTFGYSEGDKILLSVGAILKKMVGDDELYSRIHADHFIVLLKYDGLNQFESRLSKMEDMLAHLSGRMKQHYNILFRSGIYLLSQEGEDILHAIDCANYAKCTIRNEICQNTYAYYSDSMVKKVAKEKELERIMGTAIEEKAFSPFLQPKVNIFTKEIIGAEALVRWADKKKGRINAAEFLPFFEKNGFITQIDLFIYGEVCKIIREWLDNDMEVMPISCNFSKLHIKNTEFPAKLDNIAQKYGIPRDLIILEFTESIPVENWDLFIQTAYELKKYGFLIALDDFGKEYSSLALISKLPVDILKLDKIFLKGSRQEKLEKDLLKMLVKTLTDNNIDVICEGIETEEHEKVLKEINCNLAQGYLYGKPMPLSEFEKRLKKNKQVG